MNILPFQLLRTTSIKVDLRLLRTDVTSDEEAVLFEERF
jgi:hypothetical protein